MSIDLKSLLTRNPQEYKGVQLYPILLIDIDIYQIFVETVCIPKDFLYTRIEKGLLNAREVFQKYAEDIYLNVIPKIENKINSK